MIVGALKIVRLMGNEYFREEEINLARILTFIVGSDKNTDTLVTLAEVEPIARLDAMSLV